MRTLLLFLALTISTNYCFAQNWALRGTIDSSPFHEGLAVFYDTNKHLSGVINTSGEIVIPAKYKYISSFDAGMAVVTITNDKKGIIDRHDNFILQPLYKSIYPEEKAQGMYTVESDDGKYGLFYTGRLILPIEYKSIYTWYYPLIEYVNQDDSHQVLNTVTGDVLDSQFKYGNMYVCNKNGVDYWYDEYTGERIDTTNFIASSQGIVAFQDEATKLYGFKNQSTGTVTITPKYLRPMFNIWIGDAMITAIDSLSKVNPRKRVLIDSYGKEHDLCTNNEEVMYFVGDYVVVSGKKNNLYNSKGELLLSSVESNFGLVDGEKDWITMYNPNRLYDAKNKVMYPGMTLGRHDDMFAVRNDSCSYYINAITRERIKGNYYSVENFSDGLGRVKLSNDFYDVGFVDKKGNIVLRGSKKLQIRDDFSEGVVGAYNNPDDYKECFYGYIYNPLGHKGYVYNASDKMAAGWGTIRKWKEIADEAFEKKQYGKAKDYYYRIMMNKPDEAEAILDYGSCLNNLGYYDEAIECFELALDIDPSYELAQKNLDISLINKRNREEREEREEEEEEEAERSDYESARSNTFWDALGNFANILGNISGAANMYQSYSSFSSDYSSGYSSGSSTNYQSQYDMWARRAESNYNSLTNLGYSATSRKGNKSGGTLQSMSGSNYVQMKKNLRDAQREMQRIRRNAARSGVTIQQSPWETASVRY